MHDELELKYGKVGLESLVKAKIASFQGLLTRDVALKLIASEAGMLKEQKQESYSAGEIPKDAKGINLVAKISRISPSAATSMQKSYRDMQLSDSTGTISLRLWNKDVEFFSKIKIGDVIEVKGAYSRNGMLSLSYRGIVTVREKAPFTPLGEIRDGGFVNVRSFVSRLDGERSYSKGGISKNYYVFHVGTGGEEKRCVIWDSPERGKKLSLGDELIIENVLAKNTELHLSQSSRILQKPKSAIFGKLEKLDCEGEEATAVVGSHMLRFDRANALNLVGAKAAPDIKLSTIITLKKDFLLSKNITLRGKSVEGRFAFD